MSKVILYHGSPNEIVDPVFGLGNPRHDYGKGFYLTEDLNLAKEWAVSRPETVSGFVHTFEMNRKYNDRDAQARITMKQLIDSDKNRVEKVFSTLV